MGILLSGVRMPKEHEFVYVRIYGDGYATVEDDGGEVVVATASESVEDSNIRPECPHWYEDARFCSMLGRSV